MVKALIIEKYQIFLEHKIQDALYAKYHFEITEQNMFSLLIHSLAEVPHGFEEEQPYSRYKKLYFYNIKEQQFIF